MHPAEDDVREHKEALRRRLRAECLARAPEDRRADAAALCAQVAALPAFAAARVVASYAAHGAEIDPAALAPLVQSRGGRVAYPRVGDGRCLSFHVVDAAALAPGAYGIGEPPPGAAELPLDEIELVLVPGVGFDARGGRLGAGGGYYDTTLPAMPRALRVGLAYDLQLVDEVPRRAGDEPVDFIVTPSGAHPTGARRVGPGDVTS